MSKILETNLYSESTGDIVLLKDIIIPAGTVFSTAPSKTERFGNGHYMASFAVGGSKDTIGSISYCLDDSIGKKEKKIISQYFATLK